MKRTFISLLLCCVMVVGLLPAGAWAAEEAPALVPQHTYTGAGMTFEKISHVNTPLEQPDGVVDYAGGGSIAVHDPNAPGELLGDRGQSYSYAAEAYGDWVYIGTMYGGLGAAAIISNSIMGAGMDREAALAVVNAMYNGRLYISEPDGQNSGGIFFKFNVKTGETVILLSKDTNGIIPTFRSSFERDGKLYFVGMIQDVAVMEGQSPVNPMMAYAGIDMLNEAIMMQNGFPVIYEVTPAEEAEGDVLQCIYDATGDRDLDVYRTMVSKNMFTSTRAIGSFRDTLIAGCMDGDGPFLAASTDPSAGQATFRRILDMDTVLQGTDTTVREYVAYMRNDASGGGGIYQVVEFGGRLYVAVVTGHASTHSEVTGTKRSFGILRGELKDENGDCTDMDNWIWSVLVGDLADGAKYTFGISPDRIATNACTLQIYKGKLYIGDYNDVSSALQGFITNKSFLTQATNLEQSLNLYRMDAQENIEMVVGDPCVLFPEGGSSGWGSGYETHMSQYHWQATVRNDKLYLSTMDTTSLLEPLAQFTNGDMANMTPEEWESQLNYINILLELLNPESGEAPNHGNVDALVARAVGKVGEASTMSVKAPVLNPDQMERLKNGLLDGTYEYGSVDPELMWKLLEIGELLSELGEYLDDPASEEFHQKYLELLEALEELKSEIPEGLLPLYEMLLSFATEQNMVCILNSMPYLSTSVAGFDLYELEEHEDGSVTIQTVTNNGFGDMNNHGLRVFAETDDYWVIGTANPFYGTQLWRSANFVEESCPRDDTCPIHGFVDASPNRWYHDGVHYCLERGLMLGVAEDRFAPQGNMTRAMVWTVIARMGGADVSGTTPWYAAARQWAMEAGISDGTMPNDPITREQLITMLWRRMGSPEADAAVLSDFSDSRRISGYAVQAMAWAVEEGVLVGDNGRLKPAANATRAEVATMLQRFCEEIL